MRFEQPVHETRVLQHVFAVTPTMLDSSARFRHHSVFLPPPPSSRSHFSTLEEKTLRKKIELSFS